MKNKYDIQMKNLFLLKHHVPLKKHIVIIQQYGLYKTSEHQLEGYNKNAPAQSEYFKDIKIKHYNSLLCILY